MTNPIERARRIEASDARGAARTAEALAALRPEHAAAVAHVAGGVCVYGGPGSPLSRARGFGMAGPVGADALDAAVAFYRARGLATRLELCTWAEPALVSDLAARGFRPTGFVHVLTLDPRAAPPLDGAGPSAPRARRPRPDEALMWSSVVGRGFGEATPSQATLDLGLVNFELASVACFLAEVDGAPAGGGAVAVDDGLGFLFAGATLPALRRRGVQAALVRARLEHARRAGADLVAVAAAAGGASERNLLRLGFSLAYARVSLELAAG